MSYQLRDFLSTVLTDINTKPNGLSTPETKVLSAQANVLCASANDAQYQFQAGLSTGHKGKAVLVIRIQETTFNNPLGWGGLDKFGVYVSIMLLPTTTVIFCGLAIGHYGSQSENDIANSVASVRNAVQPPAPAPSLTWGPLVTSPASIGTQLVAAVQQKTGQAITVQFVGGASRGQLNKSHARALAGYLVGDVYSLPPQGQNGFPEDDDFWTTVKAWYKALIDSGLANAEQVQSIATAHTSTAQSQLPPTPPFTLSALASSPPSSLIGLNDPWRQALRALLLGKHVIFYGPPGCGKTTLAVAMCETLGRPFDLTTASAEWGAFDTIGGYIVQHGGEFSFQPGIVLRSIEQNTWLIVDEINRANIDRALGPLFSMLTGPAQTNSLVTLQFKDEDDSPLTVGFDEECSYQIKSDWRILGTMNTMDKASLFRLSYAFSRRFAFIEVPPPSVHALENLLRETITGPMYILQGQEIHLLLIAISSALQAGAEVEVGAAVLIDMMKTINAELTNGGSIVLPGSETSNIPESGPDHEMLQPSPQDAGDVTTETEGLAVNAGDGSDLEVPAAVSGQPPVPPATNDQVKTAVLNSAKMLLFPQFEGNRLAHTTFINALKNHVALSPEQETQLKKDLRLWTGVEVG